MTDLLDLNVWLAAIGRTLSAHPKVDAWLAGRSLAACLLGELGFLRNSSHSNGPFRATMTDSRALLADFLKKQNCAFIAADLPALRSNAPTSETATGCYLANLASPHGIILATLDTRNQHKASNLIG